MATKAIAAVFEGVNKKFSMREFPIPNIGPDDALLRVERAGICGSDVGVYTGKLKAKVLPVIRGHETLGFIEEIGERLSKLTGVVKGDRVVVETVITCGECDYCLSGNYRFCRNQRGYGAMMSCNDPPYLWGSYGQYMYIAPGTALHIISKDVPPEAAVLTNAVIANGIQYVRRMGGANIGDTVVIQGCGPQGLAGTVAAKESGAALIITTGLSVDEHRFPLAKEFGANYCINVEKEDLVQKLKELTRGRMADVVADFTGSPQALLTSIELVRPQGTVVFAGLCGPEAVVPIKPDKLVWNEIRIQGVFSKGVEAVRAAVKLVESRKYPLEKIVSHQFPLAEVDQALETAAGHVPGARPSKVVLVPPGA